ncbi:MAG: hypothetical protein Q8N23_00035 [Archangium sp.]|nr:hypothetical protein [Archangium sp.]MDP3569807.1 hypothetical protein [Archangium sp.]
MKPLRKPCCEYRRGGSHAAATSDTATSDATTSDAATSDAATSDADAATSSATSDADAATSSATSAAAINRCVRHQFIDWNEAPAAGG